MKLFSVSFGYETIFESYIISPRLTNYMKHGYIKYGHG